MCWTLGSKIGSLEAKNESDVKGSPRLKCLSLQNVLPPRASQTSLAPKHSGHVCASALFMCVMLRDAVCFMIVGTHDFSSANGATPKPAAPGVAAKRKDSTCSSCVCRYVPGAYSWPLSGKTPV